MTFLKGYKTYIVATLLLVVALLDVFTGDVTVANFIASSDVNLFLEAVGLGSIRHAIG